MQSSYILENGTRVLSGNQMQVALKMVDEFEVNKSGSRLARYLTQKTLKPFLYKGKEVGHFEPLICYKGDSKINGFEATILVDVCDGVLEDSVHTFTVAELGYMLGLSVDGVLPDRYNV